MTRLISFMLSLAFLLCEVGTGNVAALWESKAGEETEPACMRESAEEVTAALAETDDHPANPASQGAGGCAGETANVPEGGAEAPAETTAACDESHAPSGTEEGTGSSGAEEYDPLAVVALATQKCIAGGMILTTDNLNALLACGGISEEIYAAFYPYDGLGYYSVFVETDLNRAATTSGRLLVSAEGIADYVAGMLLLEREPYFLIEYGGVTQYGGTAYYEFKCYR